MLEVQRTQYRRILVLAGAALALAFFAIWHQAKTIYANGGLFANYALQGDTLLLACSVLISTGVVLILVRAFEDHMRITRAGKHDQETGLPNAYSLKERLVRHKAANNSSTETGLLAIGVDGLRSINVTHGHGIGNQVIRIIADRLRTYSEKDGQLFRISGDTFGFLIPRVESREDLLASAERILRLSDEPILAGGCSCFVGLSIGAVHGQLETMVVDEFLRHAELALLHRRTESGAKCVIYSSDLSDSTRRLSSLETGLRLALESDRIDVYFQPQIDSASKTIIGVEALARWQHPKLGEIPPAEFVGLAEAIGLTEKLGNVVLRKSCSVLQPVPDLRLAVNISVSHLLHPDFLTDLDQILSFTGFEPARLEIEITESIFVRLPEQVNSVVTQLRQRGISIALDDFGTGYTGLSNLKNLHVDRVKIDAEFVKGLGKLRTAEAMFQSIVDMIQQRGMQITVEGIEDQTQLRYLQQFDGFWYQGFLFGKPMTYIQLLRSELVNGGHIDIEIANQDRITRRNLRVVGSR